MIGAIIGTIFGDIAESKYEFNNTSDYDFQMFAYGESFTDDTICTVAVAEAIISRIDYQPSLRE